MKRGRPPIHSSTRSIRSQKFRGRGTPSVAGGGFSSPSPSSTIHSSTPSTGLGESSGGEETPESRKRKWSSPVWREYDCHDGRQFIDGKARAYCKYCKGGPIYADSNNGTTNFKRHTLSCNARNAGDISQLLINKEGKLVKAKIDNTRYKELVALAIIRHGYPFTFAEHEGNRAIHVYLNESVQCFTRNTAKKYCLQLHKSERKKLKMDLSKVSSKICLTTDLWTSCVGQGYLSLTVHYVDDEWILHNKILSFCHVPPPHNAQAIHEKLLELIKYWSIEKKVFSITLDNAKYNGELKTKQVKDKLYNLFEEYTSSSTSHEFQVRQDPDDDCLAGFSTYTSVTRNFSELDMYLEESKLDHNISLNVLEWWKSNEKRLPKLTEMAKDILSIPITTVASESSFSLGSRVLTKWRASLKPENAEALVTTRSWVFGYEVDKDDNLLEDGVEFRINSEITEVHNLDEEDDDVDLVGDEDEDAIFV